MKIVNQAEFEMLKNESGVLLVDFFATWCGPCKMLGPVLEEVAKEYEGKATIVKVDVDKDGALAGAYGIMAVPTMILFKDGKAVKQSSGFMPKPQIQAMLDEVL